MDLDHALHNIKSLKDAEEEIHLYIEDTQTNEEVFYNELLIYALYYFHTLYLHLFRCIQWQPADQFCTPLKIK